MAVRVGTTAHDQGGIRVSTNSFEPLSGLNISDVSPEILRPGLTATLTVNDSSVVETVRFAGLPQGFTVVDLTTIEFTVPENLMYGDREIRIEDVDGIGRGVLHQYHPPYGNSYFVLDGYPPGLNRYGDQIRHMLENFDPQPEDGMQVEFVEPALELDFQPYEDASYSVLGDAQIYIRVLRSDGDVTGWHWVNVYESGTIDPPQNLRVEDVGPYSVRLRWDAP